MVGGIQLERVEYLPLPICISHMGIYHTNRWASLLHSWSKSGLSDLDSPNNQCIHPRPTPANCLDSIYLHSEESWCLLFNNWWHWKACDVALLFMVFITYNENRGAWVGFFIKHILCVRSVGKVTVNRTFKQCWLQTRGVQITMLHATMKCELNHLLCSG